MGHAAAIHRMSVEEFLAWDRSQAQKHEFVDGEVFAMAGAEDRHVTVSLNLAILLRQHLAGTPCRTYMSDMKLFVDSAKSFFYPDVFVTCSAADRDRPLQKTDAVFVAEVLSQGSAAFDRGHKFAAYRALPTLQEYLLVDVDVRECELFRKGADGLWVLHPFAAGETVHLASLDARLPAAQLFADLEA